MVSIAELIQEQGRQAAESRLRQGQISADRILRIGGAVSNTIGGIGDALQNAQSNQYASRLQAATVSRAEQAVAAGERQAADDERGKRQSASLAGLLEMFPDGNIPERELHAVYGVEGARKVIDSFNAYDELVKRKQGDEQKRLARLVAGMRLMAPEDQATYWASIRPAMIAAGFGDERTIPERPTDNHLQQIEALGLGDDAPKPPRLTYGPVRKMRVDGKPTLVREGSDGGLYNIHGASIQSNDVQFDDKAAGSAGSDYRQYLERGARDLGYSSVSELTADEEDTLRRQWYEPTRAPQRPAGTRPGSPSAGNRPAANPRGTGALDTGLEDYILDMRGRGYTQREALDEVLRPDVWQQLIAANPKRTAERAREAISRLIPQEGAMPYSPPAGSPAGRGRGAGPSGGGSRPDASRDESMRNDADAAMTMTLAELRAAARRMGISEAEARKGYEARGFRIR